MTESLNNSEPRQPRISAVVFPVANPEELAKWLAIGGILSKDEQHGNGPKHKALELEPVKNDENEKAEKVLLEFYPKNSKPRIELNVDSINDITAKYGDAGYAPRHPAKDSQHGKFVTYEAPGEIIVAFRETPTNPQA